MNKATAPDADQRDRFFGGSDRAGKPILRRSLVVRFGCYLTLLVSLALIGMFSALLFADYTHQDAAVINHAGSLRMLTYRVALEPSLEGRQALLGTLGERLDSGDIRRLLQRQDADDPIRQLHQELREGLARLDPRALPGRAVLDAYVGDIARELHDSLAQSLSYLKIQVSRLGTLLKREAPAEKIEDTLDELREGLNGAYRQLRELLTTFRLSLDEPSLEAALGNAVAEFGERGEVAIELDNRLQHVPLSPNEEIHVLQIVREALSNVVRHSQAQRAWVRLSSQADGQVSIAVEDDGVGFDPQQNRSGHYGLTIMQERGQPLGSQLRFEARAPHGTRVLFSFVPTALQPSAAKEPTP
ncbi:histidine kinase [Pseudomonas aeruginosa]|nr:type IV pili methyl-accepting chemotaxis transducer N-terminal domain-containing protein [Pseudomonas aeruginosa]EJA9924449.1 type IV pili methyl-accepting chemotaxis transducer N-terminal domain-containing protein [Pseudomonas aeruginosa]EKU5866531.1 type IV pili methyl-accepting chemotaxis transducer N-terminal domain-containing protein [Pseudomonas aeruginosa]